MELSKKLVKEIQKELHLTPDGIMGPNTVRAIIQFQSDHLLVADGIIGPITLEELGVLDTDLTFIHEYVIGKGVLVHKAFLPRAEYVHDTEPISNDYIVLHHTVGWEDPFATVRQWGNDTRGRIATEFVIGGQRINDNNTDYDGNIVQAFPTGGQAYHIGRSGSKYMNKHSVGIELCNFGGLNENFKNYIKVQAALEQRSILQEPFKGISNFHKYSTKQLYSLKALIIHIANRDNIDIRKGLIEWINKGDVIKAFSYQEEAFRGEVKGLLTHGNIRKCKSDLAPQQELIDMLLTL